MAVHSPKSLPKITQASRTRRVIFCPPPTHPSPICQRPQHPRNPYTTAKSISDLFQVLFAINVGTVVDGLSSTIGLVENPVCEVADDEVRAIGEEVVEPAVHLYQLPESRGKKGDHSARSGVVNNLYSGRMYAAVSTMMCAQTGSDAGKKQAN